MAELTADEKQELLRNLREAYFSGAKRIRFRERDVTYRTSEEMLEAISKLENEISGKKRPRSTVAVFSTGL